MKTLESKIFQIINAAPVIPEKGINEYYKSKYATLKDIKQQIDPLLKKYNLLLSFYPEGTSTIRYSLKCLESQEAITGIVSNAEVLNAQQLGSFYTYSRRYVYTLIFNLETGDDDGNAAVFGNGKQSKNKGKNLGQRLIEKIKTVTTLEELNKLKVYVDKYPAARDAFVNKEEEIKLNWYMYEQ